MRRQNPAAPASLGAVIQFPLHGAHVGALSDAEAEKLRTNLHEMIDAQQQPAWNDGDKWNNGRRAQ